MKSQWSLRVAGVFGLAGALLLTPSAQAARTAVPGTLNYLEGSVFLDGDQLSSKQAGEAQMQPDQVLSTEHGKAEVLLSPGVFLRVGDNSQIRLVSNELVDPRVEVVRGEAMVEVDELPKTARLNILERGADTSIQKQGIYKFDADEGKIQVVDGKATVTDNGQSKELKKGKELTLNGDLKPEKFDRKKGDDLYQWSQLRSEYLAQANASSARNVYVNNGPFWGGGWYWNPYFSTFAWMPGDGYFYSPFGYPFYSPRYIVYSPVVVNPRGGHVSRSERPVTGQLGHVVAPGQPLPASRMNRGALNQGMRHAAPAFRQMGGAPMGGGIRMNGGMRGGMHMGGAGGHRR